MDKKEQSGKTQPQRKRLPHSVPAWVADGARFYVTICCSPRKQNQLCHFEAGKFIFDTARYYHQNCKMFVTLLLLMPDHMHGILSFSRDPGMIETVKDWKRYLRKERGFVWQDGFFDHRLREGTEFEKFSYIRMNPVRLGLCKSPDEWPYVLEMGQSGKLIDHLDLVPCESITVGRVILNAPGISRRTKDSPPYLGFADNGRARYPNAPMDSGGLGIVHPTGNKKQPKIVENAGLWGGRLLIFDSLPSTNQWALDNIGRCRNGDVIRAITQIAGRGRFQREWLSPVNRCLTISVVIKTETMEARRTSASADPPRGGKDSPPYLYHGGRALSPKAPSPAKPDRTRRASPTKDGARSSTITQTAALAIRSALEKYSINALVKWPNDVLVNGRKIAGILAETEPASGAVILGIGLNINLTAEDLAGVNLMQPATSMAMEKERLFDIEDVCVGLLLKLQETIDAARECATFLVDTWQHYDCLAEKRIQVETGQDIICGRYAGLDENGRLRLIDDSGMEHLFWSGDVSLNT